MASSTRGLKRKPISRNSHALDGILTPRGSIFKDVNMHRRTGGRLASSKQNTLRKIPDLRSSSGSPEASMSTSSGPSRMEHEVQPQPQPQPQNVDRPTLLSLQEEEEDARPSYQEVNRNNPCVGKPGIHQ
jgi:hypothetical protein